MSTPQDVLARLTRARAHTNHAANILAGAITAEVRYAEVSWQRDGATGAVQYPPATAYTEHAIACLERAIKELRLK